MRIANVGGRAKLLIGADQMTDIATASAGRFGPGLPSLYDAWDEFRAFFHPDKGAADAPLDAFDPAFAGRRRRPPDRCSQWP